MNEQTPLDKAMDCIRLLDAEVERLRGLVERRLHGLGGFCLDCCDCGDDDGLHATPEECSACWDRDARAALREEE
jgi:hypothetical protein